MSARTRTIAELLDDVSRLSGQLRTRLTLGYDPLDTVLDGGLRPEDLVILGGRPGVGKTITLMQWGRFLAQRGIPTMYVSYEHGPVTVLRRLLLAELGTMAAERGGIVDQRLRALVNRIGETEQLFDLVGESQELVEAISNIDVWSEHLRVVRGDAHLDAAALDRLIAESDPVPAVVLVDYLQKIPSHLEVQRDRLASVTNAAKDIAVRHGISVIAASAADENTLDKRRLRLAELRGGDLLGHEADAVILLNDKITALSKVHSAYDAARTEDHKRWVVFTIEKNRNGPAPVDIEFKKDFANYRFDPAGRHVVEHLVDNLLYAE